MTFDEIISALTEISALTNDVGSNDEPMSPQDRVDLWIVADGVLDELRVVVQALKADATLALVDLDVQPAHTFDTAFGTVLRDRRRVGSDQWAGYSICDALAHSFVDPDTGEVVRAVPVTTMRDTVAGCADDRLTSSRWKVSGLRNWLDDPERYRLRQPYYEDAITLVTGGATTFVVPEVEDVDTKGRL